MKNCASQTSSFWGSLLCFVGKVVAWFDWKRIGILAALLVPLAGSILVVWYGPWYGWFNFLLFILFFKWRAWGITAGFHRYGTHRSYKPVRFVKNFIMAGGLVAMQGPAGYWIGNHRYHHKHSGEEKDPHHPLCFGDSAWGRFCGFLWAQWFWIILSPTGYDEVEKGTPQFHLGNDRDLMFMDRHYWFFVLVSLFLHPLILGGYVFVTTGIFWTAFFYGLAWNLLGICAVQNITYLVNSVCHMAGDHPVCNKGNDTSGNVWWVALLSGGEGYHLWHHFCEWSARHGLEWWQWDDTFYLIWCLGKVRLVDPKSIRVPTREMIERAKQEKREKEKRGASDSRREG